MGFNFGGLFSSESKSNSSSSTSSNTDSRMVNDGGAIGLNTTGSTNSTVNISTNTIDGGAQLTAQSALWDMAVLGSNAIAGNGIVSNAAIAGMGTVSSNAIAANGVVTSKAIDSITAAANSMVSSQNSTLTTAFGNLLGATTELAKLNYGAQASNITLARELNQASQNAYADASQQAAGNKNLVMAGMVVVGLAAVMVFGKAH